MGELVVVKTEYDRLIDEIKHLRAKIAELIAERDELVNHICRDLQAEYDLKIGGLMLEAMQAENRVRMLKRTLEMMQAEINRGEKPDYHAAQEQVEEEYREYERKLNDKAEEIRQSREYAKKRTESHRTGLCAINNDNTSDRAQGKKDGDSPFTEEVKRIIKNELSELKQLYHKIVKRIHPDINPDITEEEKELFHRATAAYKESDLETLREIYVLLQSGGNLHNEFRNTPEDIMRLRGIRDTLQKRVVELEKEIQSIKSEFPYTEKTFLENPKAVAAKQKELQAFIMDCVAQAAVLNGRIENLRKQRDAA